MDGLSNTGLYAYEQLDATDKEIYAGILSALGSHDEGKLPADTPQELIEQIYRMVMADHPELFFISGYDIQLTAEPKEAKPSIDSVIEPLDIFIRFKGRENLPSDSITERKEALESCRDSVLAKLPDQAGEYETARTIYEYVILHTLYGGNALNGQTADASLLDGRAVCTGYARAAQYLLQGAGIQSTLITGRKAGRSHAWLLVKLDDDYYFMDPTEGDSLLAGMPSNYRRIFVNYGYFAMTSADIASKYIDDGLLVLPDCTEQKDSWFAREGRYITNAGDAELDKIRQLPEWTEDTGFEYLQFRCEKECYEQVCASLTGGEPATEYGWKCVKNDALCVLTFYRP